MRLKTTRRLGILADEACFLQPVVGYHLLGGVHMYAAFTPGTKFTTSDVVKSLTAEDQPLHIEITPQRQVCCQPMCYVAPGSMQSCIELGLGGRRGPRQASAACHTATMHIDVTQKLEAS